MHLPREDSPGGGGSGAGGGGGGSKGAGGDCKAQLRFQPFKGRPSPATLSPAEALELAVVARRYMLDTLADAAHAMLAAALEVDEQRSAEQLVPLLMTAQEACEVGASEVLAAWAVGRYEVVHAQHDFWLTCSPSALPPAVRAVGEEGLRSLLDGLRAAMLRSRHGL